MRHTQREGEIEKEKNKKEKKEENAEGVFGVCVRGRVRENGREKRDFYGLRGGGDKLLELVVRGLMF